MGVPQGSILGPLLFLLYINDLCDVSPTLSYIQFADDSNIFATGPSINDIILKLNHELESITEWIKANKLLLNISKSNFMIMTSPRKLVSLTDFKVKISDNEIEQVTSCKFLGVIIDNKMSWQEHIAYISNKISKGVGILSRARHTLFPSSLLTLYNSLIKPYFTYCVLLWGNSCKSVMNKLFMLQKRIVRILSLTGFYSHTAPLFKTLNIMNIYALHSYSVGVFTYKNLHQLFPNDIEPIFTRNTMQRQSINLRIPYVKHKSCQSSIKVVGPRIWNLFPTNIKTSKTLWSFKKHLMKHLKNIN